MIKFEQVKHFNETQQLIEGHIFKINNSDNVFFLIEKVIPTSKLDSDGAPLISEEYVARKLDGKEIDNVVYNVNNDTKRLSFEEGAPMKLDHVFVYGQMFKSFS